MHQRKASLKSNPPFERGGLTRQLTAGGARAQEISFALASTQMTSQP